MSTIEPIRITGLRDFQTALKRMDGNTQKQLRVVFNDVAEDIAGDARRLIPTRSGRAAKSMKARSGQREAKIVAGGKTAPYYPWLDFGGSAGRGKKNKRQWIQAGRYLYPTYNRQRRHIQARLEEGLVDLARNAGVDVD